jgi:hypothetical protein
MDHGEVGERFMTSSVPGDRVGCFFPSVQISEMDAKFPVLHALSVGEAKRVRFGSAM